MKKCIDCKKKIDYRATRCNSCNITYLNKKHLIGIYKTGETLKKHYCKDCHKILKNYKANRCQSCAGKERSKHFPNNMLGKSHTTATKKKLSEISKKSWNEIGNRDKIIKAQRKGMQIYPNKPEIIIKKLLIQISKDYKYVGDGSFIIDGFNPDFINTNGQKKVIEIYGTYWHKRPEVIIRDRRRIKSYNKYGYKTLILWEHELKNINKVKNKLTDFIKLEE